MDKHGKILIISCLQFIFFNYFYIFNNINSYFLSLATRCKLPLYLALLLLTQCSKCKEDLFPKKQPTAAILPIETQIGARTCGCVVNGITFATLNTIKCNGDWQGLTSFAIGGDLNRTSSYDDNSFSFNILLSGPLRDGQVFSLAPYNQPLNTTANQFAATAVTNHYKCSYLGNHIKSGRVELVKFDGVQRIAAGRFAFTLYEAGSCDTLRVIDGRFDVKF
jgi:hypothetical protein